MAVKGLVAAMVGQRPPLLTAAPSREVAGVDSWRNCGVSTGVLLSGNSSAWRLQCSLAGCFLAQYAVSSTPLQQRVTACNQPFLRALSAVSPIVCVNKVRLNGSHLQGSSVAREAQLLPSSQFEKAPAGTTTAALHPP